MALNPFMGEILLVPFQQAPQGWASCDGQLLPINQNQALFSLLGTMYGGNGQTTFALPDLRGRVPVHLGGNLSTQGATGGETAHTLTVSELPTHYHPARASDALGTGQVPTGLLPATVDNSTFGSAYQSGTNLVAMASASLTNTGGSQAHENMQPYLALHFIIALQGIFPSRN